MKENGVVIIRDSSVELALAFPFIWLLLLTVQAFREGSASIYVAMGWMAIPMALLIASSAFIRYTKIDYGRKEVSIKKAIGTWTTIVPGSLLKISEWKGVHNLSYLKEGEEVTEHWMFINYLPYKSKKILDALFTFNPEATYEKIR